MATRGLFSEIPPPHYYNATEVSNVGLSPLCIIFMKSKVVLELCSNYPQIVNEAGIIPGALEVDSINLVLKENIVSGLASL
jgi:hypothetical protein